MGFCDQDESKRGGRRGHTRGQQGSALREQGLGPSWGTKKGAQVREGGLSAAGQGQEVEPAGAAVPQGVRSRRAREGARGSPTYMKTW